MSKRVAGLLRGSAKLLEDVKRDIESGGWWDENVLMVLDGVIANLLRDADDEEQRGKDWYERYKAERKAMGIPEGERTRIPPRQEPPL